LNTKTVGIIIAAILLAGAMVAAGYFIWVSSEPEDDGNMSVVVTLLPYADFVKRVGGDRIGKVTDIVPIQAGCGHDYEMTPKQLKAVSSAMLYFAVGAGHEFEEANLDKITEQNPGMTVVDTSVGITLLTNTFGEDAGATNPHVWTSPRNVVIIVRNICAGLVKVDPAGKQIYEANRDTFIGNLSQMDNETGAALKPYNNGTFVIYHPAWSYFAKDYGLNQLPIEETEEQPPSPEHIKDVIDEEKALHLTTVYRSPADDPSSSETVAEGIDGQVVVINHMAEDYIGNIQNVTAELVKGFKG